MRVLVTGGAGFIGSNLVDYLSRLPDVSVAVLDDFSASTPELLEGFAVDIIRGDVRDTVVVNRALEGVDGVIHLAAHTRVIASVEEPETDFSINVEGTFRLLRAVAEHGIQRFVFASTGGAILGEVTPPVHENMPPRPVSPYGAAKLAGEGYCSAFAGSYGMRTVSLRFSNVYGPRSHRKGSVIAHFLKQILRRRALSVFGDGSQTRDFVYVEDLCAVIWRAFKVAPKGSCFQLGSGVGTSVNALIGLIRKTVGPGYPFEVEYLPFRQGEIKHTYSDISRARDHLQFVPSTSLETGLAETWRWLAAHSQGSEDRETARPQ